MEAWKTDVEPNHKVRSFRYVCERLVCDSCDAENPQMRVHSVQCATSSSLRQQAERERSRGRTGEGPVAAGAAALAIGSRRVRLLRNGVWCVTQPEEADLLSIRGLKSDSSDGFLC